MTEEELKKEAEEKAGIYFDSLDYDHGDVSDTPFSAYDVFVAYKKGALDFAEPREKRIAELEHQLTHRNCLDCSNHSSNLRIRNLELEKENAELKHTIATLRQEKDNVSMHAKAMEVVAKTRSDQLTKAKTYLKYFIEILKKLGANKEPLVIEAEQFLSEVEQWKK